MVDKNLFRYDLAVTAIFKDEGKYLKEWLDYHLLAGVEHFYLYNNDSSDDYAEVLAPYVEKNLVTLTNFPGRLTMYPAYNDAIERFRFECRYMAFIDLDEFIFPKTNRSIVEVVDEILVRDPKAAALGINWQLFGSNGEETADYSRGVLERFTRRAPRDWNSINKERKAIGNVYIKSVVNPRRVNHFMSPHFAFYFSDWNSINTDGTETDRAVNRPVCADKIVINHYFTKSKEEYATKKMPKGSIAIKENYYDMEGFHLHDHNEVFDDDILKYRDARADCFSPESEAQRINRLENALVDTLTQDLSSNTIETFLTCRAVAEKLGDSMAEEYALMEIYKMLSLADTVNYAD
ncbi:MAG: glycosyltransferase family 92 protein, partial [Selenomonadaceae bacterium]|nr:glycosyltransferase family 92 protein [Selenomonadaceae bacterium]